MELDWGTEDSEYLQKVELHSEGALNEVRPDIIIYNAGTDILDGDPLGGLSISPQVLFLRSVYQTELLSTPKPQQGISLSHHSRDAVLVRPPLDFKPHAVRNGAVCPPDFISLLRFGLFSGLCASRDVNT